MPVINYTKTNVNIEENTIHDTVHYRYISYVMIFKIKFIFCIFA